MKYFCDIPKKLASISIINKYKFVPSLNESNIKKKEYEAKGICFLNVHKYNFACKCVRPPSSLEYKQRKFHITNPFSTVYFRTKRKQGSMMKLVAPFTIYDMNGILPQIKDPDAISTLCCAQVLLIDYPLGNLSYMIKMRGKGVYGHYLRMTNQ